MIAENYAEKVAFQKNLAIKMKILAVAGLEQVLLFQDCSIGNSRFEPTTSFPSTA